MISQGGGTTNDSIEQGYEVVCFLANVGQDEDWAAVEAKALKVGAKKMIIENLEKEFVEELCFRAIQCNAIYEGRYLLGRLFRGFSACASPADRISP